jgi:hypothetical protein
LLFEQHQITLRIDAGVTARVVQKHQRDERHGLAALR